MDILKKTVNFTFLAFTFGEVIRLQFGDGAIKLLDIAVAILILEWVIIKRHNLQAIKNHFLFKPLLIFWFISFISLILNAHFLSGEQFLISFLYLLRWIVYSMIVFVIGNFGKRNKKNISRLLLFSGFIIVFLGYVQLFFYNDLRNLYYLGWDEHLYRMFSIFLDPNYAGVFFVLYFLFLVDLYIKKNKTYLIFLLVITLGSIYLTYSRSALMALFFGIFWLLLFYKKLLWMFSILAISLIIFVIFSKNFYIENLNLLRTASSFSRLDSASNALKIIHDQPLLGVGFDAYRYAQIRYGFRQEIPPVISHADAGTDNSFLFILATTGIIGFFSYFDVWYVVVRKLFKNKLILPSILSLFVGSLFINSLFYPSLMFWMWILISSSIENT